MSRSNTNYSSSYEGGNISNLVVKLCDVFAEDDKATSKHYFKIALKFLSRLGANTTVPTDEQYVVAQIRKHLAASKSKETVQEFDSLYTKLQHSTILQHKSAVLSFFLNLSMEGNQKPLFNNKFNMLKETREEQVPSVIRSIKSNFTFLPEDSKSNVQKLYSAPKSARSSRSQASTTTNGQSVTWTGSENEVYFKECSSGSSSTTTLPPSIPEEQLVQEIIYSFQGIEGHILKREPGGLGFIIDVKAGKGIGPIQRSMLERLSHLGFLHNQVKQHCDEADKQIGVIGQSLIAILREKLVEYYQLLAVLQANAKKQGCMDHTDLTLRRLIVWTAEPQIKLQWHAYIAEQCSDKKGGALISTVHGFLQHGSSIVQQVSGDILSAVCRPLYVMMSRWLLDGELNDPCGEFFIEARNINAEERLWHDKYHVRKAMIPSFITLDQASKILATGKSINFLRQICKDSEELPGRDSLQKLFTSTTAEALYTPEQSIDLHSTLESVYRETSLRVLDLLKGKFRLIEHLQALRRYLLLGQGDFIRHLLELLAPELCKPAQDLYGHTLSAILESAIRVTNAQYEDEDTLQRLNVALKNHSHGDTGWDVFTLVYIVDGPVGTIFQPTMVTYKGLFGALWMAKRMEFVLSNMRKQQITSAKLFRHMKELKAVTHSIHVLASEMIHFLHQTQYYFLFEVLECSWAEMLHKVNQAECLDDVINAHTKFLTSVQNGVLLDSASTQLHSQLRTIYNLILNLESIQENLYSIVTQEQEASAEYKKMCDLEQGFSVTAKDELINQERKLKFKHALKSINNQAKQLAVNYNIYVKKYLTLLSTSSDMNLQLLSVRLNFNDYYNIA